MNAVKWVRFVQGQRDDAVVVEMSDDEAFEVRRFECGVTHSVHKEVVYFSTYGTNGLHFVRLEPSTELGCAERDKQLGPALVARFVTPAPAARPVAPLVARLRQLADTLAALELPASTYASVQLVLEDVTALEATRFATALIRRAPGSYMETTPSTVAVHLPDSDAEWCVELVFPEAAAPEPAHAEVEIPLIDTTELDANVAALERTIAELNGGVSA